MIKHFASWTIMKPIRLVAGAFAFWIVFSAATWAGLPESEQVKHFYGVCWRGTPEMNMRAAQALGYKYIYFVRLTPKQAARPEAKGLRFFLETPQHLWTPTLPIKLDKSELKQLRTRWPRLFASYPKISQWFKDEWFDELKEYRPDVWRAYKEEYEAIFPWCSRTAEFPRNIAVGWVGSNLIGHPLLDFQQKAVQDLLIQTTVRHARVCDNPDNDFLFAGCAWDVPDKWEEYRLMKRSPKRMAQQRPIPGGKNDSNASAVWHPGITHDYATFREGVFTFYVRLKQALQKQFPGRKIYIMYEPWTPSKWVSQLQDSSLSEHDKRFIAGDLLFAESPSLAFLEDPELERITAAGWHSKGDLGSTTPNLGNDYGQHLDHLSALATQGSWFNSFGRFDDAATSVATRPQELVVARLIPNWDNLNAVRLRDRSWDAETRVYRSPTSYADQNVLYSRQPGTGKIFVVFRSANGRVRLHPGETVTDIRRTNELFEPVDNGADDLRVEGGTVMPKSLDSCHKCYVLSLGAP